MSYGLNLTALSLEDRLLVRRTFKFLVRHPDRIKSNHWHPPFKARYQIYDLLSEWDLEEALPDYLRNV